MEHDMFQRMVELGYPTFDQYLSSRLSKDVKEIAMELEVEYAWFCDYHRRYITKKMEEEESRRDSSVFQRAIESGQK
jgi:hypothetical protein